MKNLINIKETEKERIAKHRANLDKMRYESYVNFSNSYNLKQFKIN